MLRAMAFVNKFAYEIADDVRARRVSAEEVVRAALARAEEVEALNAFVTVAGEEAVKRARSLDVALSAGEDVGPLAGVPVVVKDNILTKGVRTTAGSKSLEHFVPPYSATVVERLEAAGAVVIAKANLDEFGMGSSNEHSAFGPVKNPWDLARVPGGSSGGSAAAVAAGVAPVAIGTDTGGSVRQPASFCGLVGFKPTYGRLSRYGVVAFASSLDQVGVLCRSAKDLALMMTAMGGHDPKDATSLEDREDASLYSVPEVSGGLEGLRVGVITELSGEGNSAGVRAALINMRERLTASGARFGEASLPHVSYAVPTYYLVAPAEASANLARYDGMTYSARVGDDALGQAEVMRKSRGATLGPEVRRRILMGTYALSAGYYDAYYGKALRVRRLIADDFSRAFETFDLLMSPTTPTTAFGLGETTDPLAMYLNDVDTVSANLVGIPAVSVPAGTDDAGLPCGVQFFAPALEDARLLRLVGGLERAAGDRFAPLAPF